MPTPAHRQPIVAVFGSSTVREPDAAWSDAHALGSELARRGVATMTGGYGGAMAAASRGAHDAGGHVIGVTVDLFEHRGPVNPWVRERVHTPDLFERLRHIVNSADGFVAVAGSIGTLSELFLVWTLVSVEGREPAPIVLMGKQWHAWLDVHRAPEFIPTRLYGFVQVAETPSLAAEAVVGGIARVRGARIAPAPPDAHIAPQGAAGTRQITPA